MKLTMPAALAPLAAQWNANPRLRIGGALIGAILVLYLVLVGLDWRAARAAHLAERRTYLARIEALSGQDVWIGRADSAAALRKALDAQVPTAATTGLAQAGVQTWMRQLTGAMGGGVSARTQAVQQVPGTDLWRIPVEVTGPMQPRGLVQLMQQIERYPSLTVIEQVQVLNRDNKTFSLTAVAYYRIPSEADRAGS